MKAQRGGFVIGLIVGLLVGLGLALGVALYVTKVPVPFMNKVPQRSPEQDAVEAEKNRNWDPNAPLRSKSPRPTVPESSAESPPAAASAASAPAPKASAARDPAAILADRPAALSTKPGADPFIYFVQTGAFSRPEEAEQQRARLGLLGLEAKLSERE